MIRVACDISYDVAAQELACGLWTNSSFQIILLETIDSLSASWDRPDALVVDTSKLPAYSDFLSFIPTIASGYEEEIDVAFLSGAQDFLRIPWIGKELFTRIDRLHPSSSWDFTWGFLRISENFAELNGARLPLNESARKILKTLARQANHYVSRKYLVPSGMYRGEGSRAIDMQIVMIRRAMATILGTEAYEVLRTSQRTGYCLIS